MKIYVFDSWRKFMHGLIHNYKRKHKSHVDNIFYWDTDRECMEIPPIPVTDTRIDYIVLRIDWTRQTERLARIAGIEGMGPPGLAAGVGRAVLDIPLAQIAITTGGDVTVKERREAWHQKVNRGR